MDSSILQTYKGSLYPTRLINNAEKEWPNVLTLVDLSCQKLVLDATSTEHAVQVVPRELCYSLMRAALTLSKDRAIEVLVACWPWPVLSLKKFVPQLFDGVTPLHSSLHVVDRMRRGMKYTTCLAHTFVECLKRRAPTRLKCLDLTGFPTAEVIVNYLSSHVLLVCNEARQRAIISVYDAITRDWPAGMRHEYSLDTTLPDESFMICVDACLQQKDTLIELCRCLKTSHMEECHFKLRIHRLDLSLLGVARISVLLDEVDPQYVDALSIQYNSLTSQGLVVLAPHLQRMTELTALDLSCNNINLQHSEAEEALKQILMSLPHLVRLDLSNNRLKHKLPGILPKVAKPLQYLRLCACGLKDSDFIYLRTSHHTSELKELDLSENCLGQSFSEVLRVLDILSTKLQVLEMEDCGIDTADWLQLFGMCRRLHQLHFWNISRNSQLTEPLLSQVVSNIANIARMEHLEALKLSYPQECYVDVMEEDDEEAGNVHNVNTLRAEQGFHRRFSVLMSFACQLCDRTPIKLVMCSGKE